MLVENWITFHTYSRRFDQFSDYLRTSIFVFSLGVEILKPIRDAHSNYLGSHYLMTFFYLLVFQCGKLRKKGFPAFFFNFSSHKFDCFYLSQPRGLHIFYETENRPAFLKIAEIWSKRWPDLLRRSTYLKAVTQSFVTANLRS